MVVEACHRQKHKTISKKLSKKKKRVAGTWLKW
jgi:hypothetical protein